MIEDEMRGHDNITWICEGPRGRLWLIVWQWERPEQNIRAWPFPAGRTTHRGHATSESAAREQAAEIATKIKKGKSS